ncbi:MAG: hypothetical protein M3O67_06965 [Bacteroidota bacterium]|nr:hypothetical protein [Bacteroidota bacterium]
MPDYAQDFLFQRMREILPQQVSLVDAVAEILHVSNDSAYRRIRGETPLVLEEAREICNHFHLSLDQMLNVSTGYTLFQTIRINNKEYSFEKYLSDIFEQLQSVTGFIKKEIFYLSKDIPLFHLFGFQPLFAFRHFFWMKSILQHPDYVNAAFSMNYLTPKILSLGQDILKSYNSIPSTEVWNTECVNSIIIQVEYYKDAGYFSSPADIRLIYDAIEETINHLKKQAEAGCKFLSSETAAYKKNNYRFFHNRAILGDNTILVITDHLKTLYLNYDVLNYMITRDEIFCNETFAELQNLIKHSTLISSVSEKQRNIFFNILLNKIEDRKRNL